MLLLGLVGCAPAAPADPAPPEIAPAETNDSAQTAPAAPGESDAHAISQLASIAARDAELPSAASSVDCWAPSEHKIAAGEFRVICRVHFLQGEQERFKDMICIGDLARDPVSDYCYQWAYYSDMPSFEDAQAYRA